MQVRETVKYWRRHHRIVRAIQYHIAEVRKIDCLYIAKQMGKHHDPSLLAKPEAEKAKLYRQLFQRLQGILR